MRASRARCAQHTVIVRVEIWLESTSGVYVLRGGQLQHQQYSRLLGNNAYNNGELGENNRESDES